MSSIRAVLLLSTAILATFLLLMPPQADATTSSSAPSAPEWDPACYSTYPQIETFLQAKATQYPTIAALIDAAARPQSRRPHHARHPLPLVRP